MKPSRSESEAIRKFRHLWVRLRPWGDDWVFRARQARQLIAEIRAHRAKDVERVELGKLSQAKGKRSQSAYVKRWRKLRYTVRDKSDLEAAGVETGVDCEIVEARLSAQTKEWKQGEHRLLMATARKAWDRVETLAFLRGHQPVLRWCENRGQGQPPCDLSVVRTDFLEELVFKARPPTS